MLFINGEPLVEMPLQERRQRLWDSFQVVEGQFQFATSRDPETTEEIEEFLDESIKGDFMLYFFKTIVCISLIE